MIEEALLTNDERQAAEAAFRALPLNPHWSRKAQRIYSEILHVTQGRDIVTDSIPESEALVIERDLSHRPHGVCFEDFLC